MYIFIKCLEFLNLLKKKNKRSLQTFGGPLDIGRDLITFLGNANISLHQRTFSGSCSPPMPLEQNK